MDKVNITSSLYGIYTVEHAEYLALNPGHVGFYFIDNRFGKMLLNINIAAKSLKKSTETKYG